MNKRVLVTGAGSGIGAGIAKGLAAAGHHVFVSDLNLDAAQSVVECIKSDGGMADAVVIDVCSESSIDAAVETIGNGIDVLVNNAGIQHVSSLEDFPQQTWDKITDILLNGTCRMTKAVLPLMKQAGHGRIINIGSIHSLVASAYKSAYVAAKHGLLGFSKTIALETANCDITINTICPSYVKTPLVDKQIAGQAKEHGISEEEVVAEIMLKPMPKSAFIQMDEITETIQFLMSEAARNITGQEIVIDGGWTIR